MQQRILIVDDEPLILSGISRALRLLCNFQGEIKEAINGREAINAAAICFYNVCFLDIKLPDRSGIDVMKEIHMISAETDIAIISGCHVSDDMQKAIEESASLFIAKPFVLSEIESFIKYVFKGEEKDDIMGKREFRRRKIAKDIGYSVNSSGPADGNGHISDISYGGFGMLTGKRIEYGQMLRLHGGTAHKTGVVRWCTRSGPRNRAGIKFTDYAQGKD